LRPVLRPPFRASVFRAPRFLAPRFAMSRVAPSASHCSQPARRKQIHCPMYDRADEPVRAKAARRRPSAATGNEDSTSASDRSSARW
jgi:hypothetical protein